MDNLSRLIEIFSHFPGIGPRQARRFAYYLLGKPQSFINDFVKLVGEVKSASNQCSECQRLFIDRGNGKLVPETSKSSRSTLCNICSDTSRDRSTLMVVARDSDFESIEKSGAYRGLYFILGGTVPVLDKEPEKRIRLKSLLNRVSETITPSATSTTTASQSASSSATSQLEEIILSLNTTPDGENTADIVHMSLNKLAQAYPAQNAPRITVLGRGLSTGAELEYVDGETIINALKNRA